MPTRGFISVIFLFLFGLLLSCGEKIEPGSTAVSPAKAVKAAVAVAKTAPHPYTHDAVGTIRAGTASTLSGKLMGIVKAVYVREGDLVKKGQVLIVIDDRQVTAQLQQVNTALAEAQRAEAAAVSARDAARAGADLARATYKRYLQLIADESVSRQEFDETEARHRQADAALGQAEAMLEVSRQRIRRAKAAISAAQVSQKDTRILAPYNGKVVAKMITVGDMAAPGAPFLTIEKSGGFQVDAIIPESYIHAVALDQKLNVTVPVLQDHPLEGVVKTIVPAADPKSRSFIVKVLLPVLPTIRSGMFARVKIPLGDDRMLLIPSSAVVVQGQLTGVYLLDADRIARFRLVRTGRTFGDYVEVISGLREGSRYVVSPPPILTDGTPVEVAS